MPANRDSTGSQKSKANATSFKSGQSGNPNGRPRTPPELVEAFREMSPRAQKLLDKVMCDYQETSDPKIAGPAVRAAELTLNRAWGTAPAVVELTGDVKADVTVTVPDISILRDPERLKRIASVLRTAGVLPSEETGEGDEPSGD